MFPVLQSAWMFAHQFYGVQQKYTNSFWRRRGSALRSLRWQSGFTMYVDVLFAGAGLVSNWRQCWQLTSKSSETVRAELFYAVEAVEVIQNIRACGRAELWCVCSWGRGRPQCDDMLVFCQHSYMQVFVWNTLYLQFLGNIEFCSGHRAGIKRGLLETREAGLIAVIGHEVAGLGWTFKGQRAVPWNPNSLRCLRHRFRLVPKLRSDRVCSLSVISTPCCHLQILFFADLLQPTLQAVV